MRVRKGIVGSIAVSLAVVLTGCGDDGGGASGEPTSPIDEPQSESRLDPTNEPIDATPEVEPTEPPMFTRSWTDRDGYAWEADVLVPSIEIIDVNTVDQKPGEALITYRVNGSGTVTHTTPGRNYEGSSFVGALWPVWAPGSAMCDMYDDATALRIESEETDDFGRGPDTGYCVDISADILAGGRYSTWTEGDQREIVLRADHDSLPYLPVARDSDSAAKITVAEDDLQHIVASITDPVFWAASASTIVGTGGIGFDRVEVPDGTCIVGPNYFAVATPGGEDVCDLSGWLTLPDQ